MFIIGKEVMRVMSRLKIRALTSAGFSLLLLGSSVLWAHSWEEATPDKENQLLSKFITLLLLKHPSFNFRQNSKLKDNKHYKIPKHSG